MSKATILLLISLLMATLPSSASEQCTLPQMELRLDISSGLAHNGATSMLRDSKGYLWIGTYDGLCRYSDDKVTTFRNDPYNRPFINNRIRTLAEGANGDIWIGTEFGVTLFSYSDYSFKNLAKPAKYPPDAELIIRKIIPMESGEVLCICENEGVITYDAELNIAKYTPSPYSYRCYSAFMLDETNVLLASYDGLYIYNIKSQNYQSINIGRRSSSSAIAVVDDHTILLAMSSGIQRFNYNRDSKGHYKFTRSGELYYPQYKFSSISLDDDGSLWLGTDMDGLGYLDSYKEDMGAPFTTLIDHFRVSCTLLSSPNTKWVATYDGGLFSLSKRRSYLKSLAANNEDIRYMRMSLIANYQDKYLIVQSTGNEIMAFDPETSQQVEMPFKLPDSYVAASKYLFSDNGDNMWIFCSGRKWFHVNDNRVTEMTVEEGLTLPLGFPSGATVDNNGNLWMGYADGLYRVRVDGDRITEIESIELHSRFSGSPIEKIRSIYADHKDNRIWVGTDTQGLYVIHAPSHRNLVSSKVVGYSYDINDESSIPSNFISCFMRDTQGDMWIGTEQGGVCRVTNPSKRGIDGLTFERFNQQEGLNNGVVKSITCDSLGRVWVATNVGLYLYQAEQRHFLGYHILDGLPFEDFWYKSATFDGGKSLFFTGSNGVMGFNVEDFPRNDTTPKVEFSSVRIFNKSYLPFEKVGDRVPLSLSKSEGNRLSLNHDENLLTLNLDVLYSERSSNHRICYQLMPTSKRWITLPDMERSISISGLLPGEHTLLVRVSDAMNNWSDAQRLKIDIAPPIWATPWAIALYIITVVLILVAIFKLLIHTQSLRHLLTIADIERKNIERVNDEKQRYFSDISHELKTPLTLLFAPLESLYHQFRVDADVRLKLLIIKRQSKKILNLVELAHIAQLNEMNLLKVERSTFNLKGFINNTTSDFQFFAQYEHKNFEVIHPENGVQIYVDADRDMIEKVVNNLLNNAFKYTKVDDSISIEYSAQGQNIVIKVCDSGYGITEEDLPHIFERFYHGDKNRINIGGTGIGLTFTKRLVELHGGDISVESRPSEGSTFTVTLPIATTAKSMGSIIIEDREEIPYQEAEAMDDGRAERGEMRESGEMGEMKGLDDLDDLDDLDEGSDKTLHIDIIGGEGVVPVDVDPIVAGSVIFVVEDNYELMLLLSQTLSLSFTVESFASGVECIDRLATRWPDLIISDVMMPEMDGLELCQRVKSDIKTSHIPVILLTARTTVDDKIRGLEVGADAYILKPFYLQHLFKRIETLLRGRILLRNRYQIGSPVSTSEINNSPTDNEFLERLFALFSKNIDNEDLDVYSLAAELGLNRSFFLQKIKSTTNYSPYELLKDFRLKRAAELLNGNEHNVNEVCAMTGFKSRTHFSRLFKERYGLSPSRFARGGLAPEGKE